MFRRFLFYTAILIEIPFSLLRFHQTTPSESNAFRPYKPPFTEKTEVYPSVQRNNPEYRLWHVIYNIIYCIDFSVCKLQPP